ncbi:NAD(P)H-dependent oxidoreductase [Herbidospora yilanensis]|uniref:NAD(P)H-dependent oxidoreductase n=1 Tax=Herbidospora yilanensis TaxID=354426 RepID=UPI0007C81A0B|nr:NAD(P)H-dependent oxidoreductase [Herbidospora yilanensis]
MALVVAMIGGPVPGPTASVVEYVAERLELKGHTTVRISPAELPPAALLAGDSGEPHIRGSIDILDQADGVVVATPIFQSSFSGLLKAFLDVLPPGALAGKVALPLANGGSRGHLLAVDYALRPVLTALGCGQVGQGAFVLDSEIVPHPCGVGLKGESEARVTQVCRRFADTLADAERRDALSR